MFKKPDWISSVQLKGYFTASQLNKLISIDDIQASSYISRSFRTDKPVKGFKKNNGTNKYRLLDLLLHATVRNCIIKKPEILKVKHDIESMLIIKEKLKKEITQLQETKNNITEVLKLKKISSSLTTKSLLTETEIVGNAISYKKICGIYFLISKSKICYVGQSTNILSRVTYHEDNKNFDSISYVECKQKHLDVLESLYIHTLRPELNGKGNKHQLITAPIPLRTLLENF